VGVSGKWTTISRINQRIALSQIICARNLFVEESPESQQTTISRINKQKIAAS
jgi:hypothetical protein